MKKAIYIATCLLGLSISSCSDFLEQDNRSDVPSNEFYNTKTGFNSLLNSTYSSLRSIYGGAPWVFSAGTDLLQRNTTGEFRYILWRIDRRFFCKTAICRRSAFLESLLLLLTGTALRRGSFKHNNV